MKRNLDLLRNLLIFIEERNTSEPIHSADILIDGHSDVEIGLHLNLMADANFIVGEYVKSTTNPDRIVQTMLVFDLTWRGHEYLDTIRDPEIWRKTKEISKKSGNATFEFAIEIAKSLAKQGLSSFGIEVN